jgi:hypothetical protein
MPMLFAHVPWLEALAFAPAATVMIVAYIRERRRLANSTRRPRR